MVTWRYTFVLCSIRLSWPDRGTHRIHVHDEIFVVPADCGIGFSSICGSLLKREWIIVVAAGGVRESGD